MVHDLIWTRSHHRYGTRFTNSPVTRLSNWLLTVRANPASRTTAAASMFLSRAASVKLAEVMNARDSSTTMHFACPTSWYEQGRRFTCTQNMEMSGRRRPRVRTRRTNPRGTYCSSRRKLTQDWLGVHRAFLHLVDRVARRLVAAVREKQADLVCSARCGRNTTHEQEALESASRASWSGAPHLTLIPKFLRKIGGWMARDSQHGWVPPVGPPCIL